VLNTPITETEVSKIQSSEDKNGQDLHAAQKQSTGDKNLNAVKEATAKGFSTTSNYN
jgi:hypothetical protein